MSIVLGPTNQLILHWIDRNGKHSTMDFWLDNTEVDPTAGAALALADAAQALSNGLIFSVEIKRYAVQNAPGSPATGPYDRSADKLSFVFTGLDGSPVTYQIGGPLQSAINANRITAKVGDAGIVDAFISAIKTNATTAEGLAITSLARSYRRRPPRRKKQ